MAGLSGVIVAAWRDETVKLAVSMVGLSPAQRIFKFRNAMTNKLVNVRSPDELRSLLQRLHHSGQKAVEQPRVGHIFQQQYGADAQRTMREYGTPERMMGMVPKNFRSLIGRVLG